MKFRVASKYIPLLATAAVLIGLYAAGCLSYRNFSSPRVLVNLFGDNAVLGIAAVGATFVILSGGIDLSVGAMVAFTSMLIAKLVGDGMNPLAAMAIAAMAGALFGTGMGCLIQWYELPPFLVTLVGMFLARGLGFVVYPQSINIKHPMYLEQIKHLAIPLNPRYDLPFTATCYLLVFGIALYIAHYTRFGRSVYAIGGDEQSAKLMGLPVGRTKILIYTVSGFCSGLAGIVHTFYFQAGDPNAGIGLELEAIAAVVIGGTLLSGGVGFMAGTVMGVLIQGLIQTIITFQGNLNSWWTKIVVGLLLFVFILLQNVVALASRRIGARPKH